MYFHSYANNADIKSWSEFWVCISQENNFIEYIYMYFQKNKCVSKYITLHKY